MDARIISEKILNSLLNGELVRNTTFFSFRRIATWDVSLLDYAFIDDENNRTVGVFFANDESIFDIKVKAITLLSKYDNCIVAFDITNIHNASFFVEALSNDNLESLPIGVVVYDSSNNISVLHILPVSSKTVIPRTDKEQKSYWCWWRDTSHYEVATLLKLSEKYRNINEDIYTAYVYPEFFNMMISGDTQKWDGTPRSKKYTESSYKADKQNYKIPMVQLGFWDAETGNITEKGYRLLKVIDSFGVDSEEYFNCLAKIILLDGKHLDLIKDLEEFQITYQEFIPEKSSEFFILFDEYMMKKNSVGTRKPSAVKTGAKKSYVRDEPKLWNKLGIVKLKGVARYFTPFKGIEFDWIKINKILLSNIIGE